MATPRPVRERDATARPRVFSRASPPSAEGATIAQIAENTDWRLHTVQGFFAGALKKKLGLEVTSEKAESGERTYRLPPA